MTKRAPPLTPARDDASVRKRDRGRDSASAAADDPARKLLRLQRTAGNSAVGSALGARAISAVGDPSERNADDLARTAMRVDTSDDAARAEPGDTREAPLDHAAPRTPDERALRSVPPTVQQVVRSPGRALDDAARTAMESRFGHDFAGVQVHDDRASAQSARDVGADAYTVGPHVVFDSGQFSPSTHEGQSLLAHELAHVVQQTGDAPVATTTGGLPVVSRQPKAPGAGSNFTPAERDLLAAARQKIQPNGGAIVGVLITEDGRQFELQSGGGQGFSSHIEGKATAKMRELNITKATLLVELPPCQICDRSTYPGGEQGPEIPLKSSATGKEIPYQTPKISSGLPKGSVLKVVDPTSTGIYHGTAAIDALPGGPPGAPPGAIANPSTPGIAPKLGAPEGEGAPATPKADAPKLGGPEGEGGLVTPKVATPNVEGVPAAPKPAGNKAPGTAPAGHVEMPELPHGESAFEGMGSAMKMAAAAAALDVVNNLIKGAIADEMIEQRTQAELQRLDSAFQAMVANAPPPNQIHAIFHVQVLTFSHDVVSDMGVEEKTGFPMVFVHGELADHGIKAVSASSSKDNGMTSMHETTADYSVLLLDVEKAIAKEKVRQEEQKLNERLRAVAKDDQAQPRPAKQAPPPPKPAAAEGPNNALLPKAPAPTQNFLPGAPPPSLDQEGRANSAKASLQSLLAEGIDLRNKGAPPKAREDYKAKILIWRAIVKKLMRDTGNNVAWQTLDGALRSFDEHMVTLASELGIDGWRED